MEVVLLLFTSQHQSVARLVGTLLLSKPFLQDPRWSDRISRGLFSFLPPQSANAGRVQTDPKVRFTYLAAQSYAGTTQKEGMLSRGVFLHVENLLINLEGGNSGICLMRCNYPVNFKEFSNNQMLIYFRTKNTEE